MKLEKIFEQLNSLEKNSFIKIVDNLIIRKPAQLKYINKILADTESGLKSADNIIIAKIFDLIESEFKECLTHEFVNTTSQLDIITDIIVRDGNCIMKFDWFSRLYDAELASLKKKVKALQLEFDNPKSDMTEQRRRDYKIYKKCLETAYTNDLINNRDAKITDDELTILITLAQELELSQEEVKLINYMIIPIKKLEVESIITEMKNLGLLFYSKKNNTIYIADEVVRVLRSVRGKELADKFFKRVLRLLREPQINLIAKRHNIDPKQPFEAKIREIISEGVSLTNILTTEIFKEGTSLNDKKKFLNELCDKGLDIQPALKGVTLLDKINNLLSYFENLEKDDTVSITLDGYEKMVQELSAALPKLNIQVKDEFQLQDENVLKSTYLLDYNIKPRDILEVLTPDQLDKFIKDKEIKSRGNKVLNVLESFKNADNIFLENYENVGFRNLNALKSNGVDVKEVDLGIKFEEITKSIFEQLGFDVDEKLRKEINTNKDKIDILLNLGPAGLILVECKTVKESGYNKFSAVSRQMKSYTSLVKKNDLNVIKCLLVAPEFSDDFVNETELEYDLNLSLLSASALRKILEGFKDSSKHKQFPYKLLMRDVLIQEDRIVKAMKK